MSFKCVYCMGMYEVMRGERGGVYERFEEVKEGLKVKGK